MCFITVDSQKVVCACFSCSCCPVNCRYLFQHWSPLAAKRKNGPLAWSSTSELMIANLLRLQSLDTVHGMGSVRLINARAMKPAETAIAALPPCYASLTTRKQGDRVLSLSFHLALLGQVRQLGHAAR